MNKMNQKYLAYSVMAGVAAVMLYYVTSQLSGESEPEVSPV